MSAVESPAARRVRWRPAGTALACTVCMVCAVVLGTWPVAAEAAEPAVPVAHARVAESAVPAVRARAAEPALPVVHTRAVEQAVQARAAPGTTGKRLAAALRRSPLYVDPSLSSAFPAAARAQLLKQIHGSPAPVYVLALPLVNGGDFASGEQLATVVHDHLGGAGIYLTLDAGFGNDINAYTWPSDPQGLDAAPFHAGDAAQAADLSQDMQNATLPDRFIRCITLIRNGHAVAADQAAQRQLDKDRPVAARPPGAKAHGTGTPVVITVIVIAALGVGAGAGWLTVRRRNRRPSPFVTPHAVFSSARTATKDELRAQAQQQLIDLGELVEEPGSPTGPRSGQAEAQIARALDAYQAAGKVLDGATGLPDLAGVLVLTHLGRNAAAAAQALRSGRRVPVTYPLCFFNPLHGNGVREIRWRPLGERETLEVNACRECAVATARRRLPEVLTDHDDDGQEIPYYEADPERSVWAETGYGQFGGDLIQRILTRGIHPAP